MSLLVTLPSTGREGHVDNVRKRPKTAQGPILPKEDLNTPQISIRRTQLPRGSTKSRLEDELSTDVSYAMKFDDTTWSSTTIKNRKAVPDRKAVVSVAENFERNLDLVDGFRGLPRAAKLQGLTDLLIDELGEQLRVYNLGQAKLLERARNVYAEAFGILEDDVNVSHDTIATLQQDIQGMISERDRAIELADIRVHDAEQKAANRIAEYQKMLDDKQIEYDTSMKQFLEQKVQLEEHVKALHHVFLDFKSDAVYLTLENIKQDLAHANAEVAKVNKENERLTDLISGWEEENKRLKEGKAAADDTINQLRLQLSATEAHFSQLYRQFEMLKREYEDRTGDRVEINQVGRTVTYKIHRIKKTVISPVGLLSKIEKIHLQLGGFLSKISGNSVWNSDEILGSDFNDIMDKRLDQILLFCSCLDNLDLREVGQKKVISKESRFERFFLGGIDGIAPDFTRLQTTSIYAEVRRIFQTRYDASKWGHIQSFPDFVVSFYISEANTLSGGLHLCKRLWHRLKDMDAPEINLFRGFLKEDYSNDEIAYFLEMRYQLLGHLSKRDYDKPYIMVSYEKCKALFGENNPVSTFVSKRTDPLVRKESIDYAAFMIVLLDFYAEERKNRLKTAISMITSKQGTASVDVLMMTSVLETLGYRGSIDSILEIYRRANMFKETEEIKAVDVFKAMDELGCHLECAPVDLERYRGIQDTREMKAMLSKHWMQFGQWFEGLQSSKIQLTHYEKSRLQELVRRTELAFTERLPAAGIFAAYTKLLRFFQSLLFTMGRGVPEEMDQSVAERQLFLLEESCGCLFAFILGTRNRK